jgi:hypothetical protein
MNVTNSLHQKILNISAHNDHIKDIVKNSKPINGLIELIWNSLDADATDITIQYRPNELGGIDFINCNDNGHGIDYDVAEREFSSLGGSYKKIKLKSPNGRTYHGKEGKGRYKSLLLGHNIKYKSIYIDKIDNIKKEFEIRINEGDLSKCTLSEQPFVCIDQSVKTGVSIEIKNTIATASTFEIENMRTLEALFAVYYLNKRDFSIVFDNTAQVMPLDFENQILIKKETAFADKDNSYIVKLIHWKTIGDSKLHYCNKAGISLFTDNLGIRTQFPLSLYIISDYVDKLNENNEIIGELNPQIADIKLKAQTFVRDYIREIKCKEAEKLISSLKEHKIYPYKDEPLNEIEKVERQMFDIIALELDEHLDIINKRDSRERQSKKDKSTKFVLELIKNALRKDHNTLSKLLEEVVNLSRAKREELTDLIQKTPLAKIIDTTKEVTDRLSTIQALRAMLFERDLKKAVKERKHLQQIVQRETWIFGNDYADGSYDVNLENVLKAYLEFLKRDGFQGNIEEIENIEEKLADIPDICLFNQYGQGKAGYYENLVIELKRPSKTITEEEIAQIKRYAMAVSEDGRFPKDKTEWKFILLADKLNKQAEFDCKVGDRKFGHIHVSEDKRVNVYVVKWGDLLNEAEAKLNYLKEKLNYNILSNKEALEKLNKKYSEYLPSNTMDLV